LCKFSIHFSNQSIFTAALPASTNRTAVDDLAANEFAEGKAQTWGRLKLFMLQHCTISESFNHHPVAAGGAEMGSQLLLDADDIMGSPPKEAENAELNQSNQSNQGAVLCLSSSKKHAYVCIY
jgi:hypothetical protein